MENRHVQQVKSSMGHAMESAAEHLQHPSVGGHRPLGTWATHPSKKL